MDEFELQRVDGLPVPKTKAEFWDSQLECLERKKRWLHSGLLYIIEVGAGRRNLSTIEVMMKLVELIAQEAKTEKWNVSDRVVRFDDGSRLVLFDIGGNTCAGLSRVLPGDDRGFRNEVRGGKPYRYGVRTAWYWTTRHSYPRYSSLPFCRSGAECPKEGAWLREHCQGTCRREKIWTRRMLPGDKFPDCAFCGRAAGYQWLHP